MKYQYIGLKRATLDFGNGNTAEIVMGQEFSLENSHPETQRAIQAGAIRELEKPIIAKPEKSKEGDSK